MWHSLRCASYVFLFSIFIYKGYEPAHAANNFETDVTSDQRQSTKSQSAAIKNLGSFPYRIWSKKEITQSTKLLKDVPRQIASPSLNHLLVRLLLTQTPSNNQKFEIMRLQLLFEMGRLNELISYIETYYPLQRNAVVQSYYTQALFAHGEKKRACEQANKIPVTRGAAPKKVITTALKLVAYCTASLGFYDAAMLSVNLAQEQGDPSTIPFEVLNYKSSAFRKGFKLKTVFNPKTLSLADQLFLSLANFPLRQNDLKQDHLKHLDLAVLHVIARDESQPWLIRAKAAEHLAYTNIHLVTLLKTTYLSKKFSKADLRQALKTKYTGSKKRALLYRALSYEKDPYKRSELIKAFWKSIEKAGLNYPGARLLSKKIAQLPHVDTLRSFSETALIISLAASQFKYAANWAVFGSIHSDSSFQGLLHWMTLVEIAQIPTPKKMRHLHVANNYSLNGQFNAEALHRLISALDALDYEIPHPLWTAASQSAQPAAGYLPEPGHLTRLVNTARNNHKAAGILMISIALGNSGPKDANVIATKEVIKALKKLGFVSYARRIAIETLLPVWPRQQDSAPSQQDSNF